MKFIDANLTFKSANEFVTGHFKILENYLSVLCERHVSGFHDELIIRSEVWLNEFSELLSILMDFMGIW